MTTLRRLVIALVFPMLVAARALTAGTDPFDAVRGMLDPHGAAALPPGSATQHEPVRVLFAGH